MDFEIKDGVAIIPEGAMEIGELAFKGCTSLESIVIPKGVTMIGGSAFKGCTSLTTVTLPVGVKHINYYWCPIIIYWSPIKIEDVPFIAVSDTYNSPAQA